MTLKCKYSQKQLCALVCRQTENFWPVKFSNEIETVLPQVLERMKNCFERSQNKYIRRENEIVFNVEHAVSYAIFLYLLSNELYKAGKEEEASYIYYLNKIMHSVDWFYAIDLPTVFMAEHPLGSVLGRAVYKDYFMVYQGCTVGGNRKDGQLYYPEIGHHVIMFANSTLLGNSHIGNYVVMSSGVYIKDEDIPDNCIVFGKSPHLIIKKRSKNEMGKIFEPIWELTGGGML